MLITFRSQAAGDVMMFANVAKQMLSIIGKEHADKGIVTVAQLPEAIEALKRAIAADKAAWTEQSAAGRPETQSESDGERGAFVSASQHAQPLLELFEWSLKDDKPVLWTA